MKQHDELVPPPDEYVEIVGLRCQEPARQDLMIEKLQQHRHLLKNEELMNDMMSTCVLKKQYLVVQHLLAEGVSANSRGMSCVLSTACSRGDVEMVRLLLKYGADSNVDRPIIAAMNGGGKQEIFEMLIESGVELNRLFSMFGDKDGAKTVLDFCPKHIPLYKWLREKGAKHAEEVRSETPNAKVYD